MTESTMAPRSHEGLPAETTSPGALYRFEAQIDPSVVGLVPEGLRITIPFDGRVVDGDLADAGFLGARVRGIDHFLLRSDGVGIIDAPKTLTATDGRQIFEHVRAYCLPPEGLELPSLQALAERDFQWPDLFFPIHGFSTFRVAKPELGFLNRAQARIDGAGNFATGRLEIVTRILEPISIELSAPAAA